MNTINLSRYVVAFLAFGIALNACRYFLQNADTFSFEVQRATYANIYPLLYIHIAGGVVALVTGAFQFFPASRTVIARHRYIGRTYLAAITISALAGFPVAASAYGGISNSVAFWILSTLWLFTTYMALIRIRQGDVQAHRMWMIRSYALTFAAVTLRIELGLLIGFFGLNLSEAYLIVPWSCWVLNLLAVEWFFQPRSHTAKDTPLHFVTAKDTPLHLGAKSDAIAERG